MRLILILLAATAFGGCQTLKGLDLPDPQEAGNFFAHEIGLATYDDVEVLRDEMRSEGDALRQHSDAADAQIRTDFAAADEASLAAYQAALADGKSEAEAIAAAAAAKADMSNAKADEAAKVAKGAADAVGESREQIDQAIARAGPEGPITGVEGWLGILLDLGITYLLARFGVAGVKVGGKAAGSRIAKAVAKAGDKTPPAAA